MKVKELIAKLKKMPQDLSVYWADHDHGTYETNSIAGCADLIDKAEMTEWDNDRGSDNFGQHDDPTFKDTPQKYVCIRP